MFLRVLFIFTLILSGINHSLFAQTEKKNAISVSYYPLTMYMITNDKSANIHNNKNFLGKEYEAIFGNYGYKAVGYNTHYYGAWEIAYKRILSKQFQFNLGLGCELSSKQWDLYDIPDGPRLKRINDYRIILLPGIDCFLLNREYNKLWFSVQTGAIWIHRGLDYFDKEERNRQNFAWQFWFVYEQKINNSLSINIGNGYGTMGILKIGISNYF